MPIVFTSSCTADTVSPGSCTLDCTLVFPTQLGAHVCEAQIWPFSNLSQQRPKSRNTSQHGGQTHATYCAQQCCDMLRCHVAIVWPGLDTHVWRMCVVRVWHLRLLACVCARHDLCTCKSEMKRQKFMFITLLSSYIAPMHSYVTNVFVSNLYITIFGRV